jgi:transposase
MPLYRQEQQWEQMGIELSRQTMSNWMIQSSDRSSHLGSVVFKDEGCRFVGRAAIHI